MSKEEKKNEGVKIRLLTLKGCDYCDWLKSELDASGISYVNIDANEHSKFSDEIEEQFKTKHYPITFIDLGEEVVTIVSDTELETSDTLRTYRRIPELVEIIKTYI